MCLPASVVAQRPALLPPLIQLTGVLIRSDEKPGEFYPALEVTLAGEDWTFHVRAVESLTDGRRGAVVLSDLGSYLRFLGPPKLVDLLQSDATQGLPMVIVGRLYTGRRALQIESVKVAATASKAPAGVSSEE